MSSKSGRTLSIEGTDGVTPLETVGDTYFQLTCGHHTLKLSKLVVDKLNCGIIGGVLFHSVHHIFTRIRLRLLQVPLRLSLFCDCQSDFYLDSARPYWHGALAW